MNREIRAPGVRASFLEMFLKLPQLLNLGFVRYKMANMTT